MKLFSFLVGAALCVALPAAANAQSASTPPGNAPDLVRNGNFETIENGQALGWNFHSARPEFFKVSFPTEPARGKVARMDVSSAVMSGYFSQEIAVQPRTSYRLTGLARVTDGKTLIYIHGGAGPTKLDTRIYVDTLEGHPLVPWFWKKEWIQGSSGYPNPSLGLVRTFIAEAGQWHPVSLDFNSGELNKISISLGAYFEAGEYAFDDISVKPLPAQ